MSAELADADIDEALSQWRQGDCVLGEHWFVARALASLPLTSWSREGCDPDTGLYEIEVPGFVVLTQTCDLVRRCAHRPFVQVAALVEVDEKQWELVCRGHQPRFAVVPALEDRRLIADLDRIMTLEKAPVATWERTRGLVDDEQARIFALAVARKYSRIAFPDDFVEVVRPLQSRIVEKHGKQTPEGRALRSLRE